jgi:lipopolysaccharide export system protein LptA
MSGRKGWLTLFLLLVPALARGQGEPSGKCAFDVKAERQGRLMKLPSGQMNGFTGGNVVATCRSQGLVLRSDSLESYGDEGRIVFIGHVDYNERRLKLKADQATYFQRDERLLATQNVVATLPTGSTIRGPQLEFLRAVPRIRPHQSATAIGRPTIDLVQKDAQGGLQPPVKVTGNTVWLQGDSIVSAQGNVVVVRPQLTATGDSLYGDAGSGLLRLMRSPKIVGTKGRPFTLVGDRPHHPQAEARAGAREVEGRGAERGPESQVRHDRHAGDGRSAPARHRLGKEPSPCDLADAVRRRRLDRRPAAGPARTRAARDPVRRG